MGILWRTIWFVENTSSKNKKGKKNRRGNKNRNEMKNGKQNNVSGLDILLVFKVKFTEIYCHNIYNI